MVTVVEKPVVCPVLIGRTEYVQALTRCVAEARDGRGQAVLVSGEAGVGKSRLVSEIKARAASEGVLVLQGNCFEPDRLLPYAPLLDLLRALMTAHSPQALLEYAGPAGPELARLLPALAALLPDRAPLAAVDPAAEKRRIFDALASVFAALAGQAPLLVVIEDLHWSDDTSLDFLPHLTRRIAALPLLLVCTYRGDEVHTALRHALAGLDRERVATELALPRLDPSDVDAMLGAIFDLQRPAGADFLHALYALTEGNPFFIEETLKSLNAEGDITYIEGAWERKPLDELRIPRTVQDAVERRTALLTAGARRVLVLAAVAGRRFPFDLLTRLVQLDDQELLERIKELIAAQLVVETPDEQFAFRHALTRQAVYSALLARERRALHSEIAQTMEHLYASALDTCLADLAYHFSAAGVWEKALEYARRAGESALALYAPRAAVEQFNRAIEAAAHLNLEPSARLYRARGQAQETLGDFEGALADHETALRAAREAADRREEWRSLMELGALWAERDYTRTGDYFQQATELAQALGDGTLRAHSLNRLGNWLLNTGRVEESLAAHDDALALFTALHDPAGRAETLDLLSMTSGLHGDVVVAVECATEAIDLFRGLGDQQRLSSCLAGRVAFSSAILDAALVSALRSPFDCERDIAEALHLARQIDWPARQAYAHIAAGQALSGFCPLGAALDHTREALRLASEIGHQQWIAGAYCTMGAVYLAMLAPDPAIEALQLALPLARALGSTLWIDLVSAELALAYVYKADLVHAEATLDAPGQGDAPAHTAAGRRVVLARGELALARGRHEAALRQAQDLIDSAPGAPSAQPIPALLKLKGEALLALGRLDEAEAALRDAELGAAQRSALPLAWQVYRALGRVRRAGKREEEAERAYTAAREVIARVAATIDDEPLRAGFLSAALATLPGDKPLTPLRAAKQSYSGLTARERDVAALIGQGSSNRDIAAALVLSERTVASHVGHILTKLDFTSRAQIAVWAHDKGLL